MKKTASIITFIIFIGIFVSFLFIDDSSSELPQNVLETKAIILKTDNSNMLQSGVSKIGTQILEIKIISGEFKNTICNANNLLTGKMDLDNYYEVGDKIIVAIMVDEGKIIDAKSIDLYRQPWLLALFGIFIICLLVFAGSTGIKALFSFVASLVVIWKFLIPNLLAGHNPLLLATLTLILLSAIIIFSVAGFTKKGISAFVGTVAGLVISILITMIFGSKMNLHGMTAPFSETLIFSGYMNLNMRFIFYASIIIGASGAAMDIAMDVSASMAEIKDKRPDISVKELITSGFNIGKAVIGTMTTTLLLAYSGGYLTLLMLFMVQNSSFSRMINLKIVSAEIMRTLVGSIGLVLVAPFTALFAGWIYSLENKKSTIDDNVSLIAEVNE